MKDYHDKDTDIVTRTQLLENIFNHLSFGIAVVSPQMEILEANHQFYEIIRLSADSSLPQDETRSFWEQQDITGYLTNRFENADYDMVKDVEYQKEEGITQHIRILSQPLQKDVNLPVTILLTLSDVSEVKQVEKTQDNRIRHMMHELRNPLSNISLCVELLADSTKDNNQEDTDLFLSKAATSVQRMKQLINDLNSTRKSA